MSQDIVIQESGVPKTLSAISRIETNLYDGGTVGWVLDEDLDLAEKKITENGTYEASDDGAYAYSKVVVKIPNKEKPKKRGKRPSGSGDPNDYVVERDDNGNLKYTKLPTSINIINPPSKTVYNDNELIKKQGMLVRAYFADGGLWGDVPNGEITLDPDRADVSKAPDTDEWDVSGLGLNEPLYFTPVAVNDIWTTWTDPYTVITEIEGSCLASKFPEGGGNRVVYYISGSPFKIHTARLNGRYADVSTASLRTVDGKSAYVVEQGSFGDMGQPYPTNSAQSNALKAALLAYNDGHAKKGQQTITAKWPRPEDNKILTDTFSITVNSGSQTGNAGGSGGGGMGGGGGGSW